MAKAEAASPFTFNGAARDKGLFVLERLSSSQTKAATGFGKLMKKTSVENCISLCPETATTIKMTTY